MPAEQNGFDRLVRALGSTISLKIVMAVTGVLLAGFVLIHMTGHLQMFIGRDAYNEYGEFMQSLGPLLWVARLGLLTVLAAHVGAMATLLMRNQSARPERYAGLRQQRTSLAAMYMTELGIVLLVFIVYHLLHFTIAPIGGFSVHHEFGGVDYYALQQVTEEGSRRDLYSHFVISFQQPAILLTYVLATLALAGHLAHGVTSACKTVGLAIGRWKIPFELLGPAFAVFIGLGFLAPPLAVFVGIIQ